MSDQDEYERVLRRAKLFGEDSLNDLDRWRLRGAREEQARAKQKQAEAREQHEDAVEVLRAELQQEVAALRGEMDRLHEVVLEATGQALGEVSDKACDWAEKLVRELKNEMTTSVARIHGEVMGRIDNLLPEPRTSRAKSDFKFAAERDDGDVIDLPNPLVRKTTMN
jgi:hypothetical protein